MTNATTRTQIRSYCTLDERDYTLLRYSCKCRLLYRSTVVHSSISRYNPFRESTVELFVKSWCRGRRRISLLSLCAVFTWFGFTPLFPSLQSPSFPLPRYHWDIIVIRVVIYSSKLLLCVFYEDEN